MQVLLWAGLHGELAVVLAFLFLLGIISCTSLVCNAAVQIVEILKGWRTEN